MLEPRPLPFLGAPLPPPLLAPLLFSVRFFFDGVAVPLAVVPVLALVPALPSRDFLAGVGSRKDEEDSEERNEEFAAAAALSLAEVWRLDCTADLRAAAAAADGLLAVDRRPFAAASPTFESRPPRAILVDAGPDFRA